jgi:hypothetical protein
MKQNQSMKLVRFQLKEYKNLLEGFEIEKIVTDNAEELEKKVELNRIVTAAITGLSAIL